MPQTTDLLDLRGVGQRAAGFRFELLNQDDELIGEIFPLRESGPTITHDTTRTIQRDLQGLALNIGESRDVNTLSDRVRPSLVLQDGSIHPLGIFIFTSGSRQVLSAGRLLSATLVDKGIILDQEMDRSVSVSRHSSIRGTLLSLLNEVGLQAIVSETAYSFGGPVAWPSGTRRSEILAAICQVGGYALPWFDHTGVCHVEQMVDPEQSDDVIVVYGDGRNIFVTTPVESDDLLDAPNRYIVVSSNAAQEEVVGVFDIPAGAPHSAANRGFVSSETISTQGLSTVAQAVAVARAHALGHSLFEYASYAGPPDPRHDSNNVVIALERRWLETQWSLNCGEGREMLHSLRRVYGSSVSRIAEAVPGQPAPGGLGAGGVVE